MNQRKPPSEQEVEALVRTHLDRQADTVDAPRMVERVRKGIEDRGSKGRILKLPSIRSLRRWGVGAVAAAAIVLAVLLGLQLGPGQANAETLVRAAQKLEETPLDRCYQVLAEPVAGLPERPPFLAPPREAQLWTRGDRFWIEMTIPVLGRKAAWGRDELGRVWVAPSPRTGFRFEPEEVPEPVAQVCDLRSMQVGSLLNDVLTDFDLRWEEPEDGSTTETRRIQAELKPGRIHPALHSATLDINSRTKVVQRVVLKRMHRGKDLGTVTFTLVDTRPQSDAQYRLEGHLNPDAAIFSKDRPGWKERRGDFLRGKLGPLNGKPW